ncbi:MAG: PEGA domain-containing protein, partial [Vicinamibacterales bacterium]
VGLTPLTLRSLPYGTHTLRVTREGYESESRRVIISNAQPAQSLILDLGRSRNGGAARGAPGDRVLATLAVESRPPGASVFLNGRRVGMTPLLLDPAPSGSHALRLELEGYRRWTATVRVAAGERNRVTASLEQD